MTQSIEWNSLRLKKNPFKIFPEREKHKLVWAGLRKNKSSFERILLDCFQLEDSKIVLIVSRYGGGKTHASFYFSKPENLPVSLEQFPQPINLIIKTPQDGNKAVSEFYESIIEQIKWRNIENAVRLFREIVGDAESLNTLESWVGGSEDLAKLIWEMGNENQDIVFQAQQALFGQDTATIKKTLRIRRTVNSNPDRTNVLSGIFRLLGKYGYTGDFTENRKIMLWIDETESLIYYTSKQYRPFTQFLRDLFDTTPRDLTLFLNFSFADPSDEQSLEIVLGEALIDRVTRQIIFDEADVATSKLYIRDLLNHYRTPDFDADEYHPFTEESIDELLTHAYDITQKPRTPRVINKWCLRVIQEAVSRSESQEALGIDTAFVETVDFSDD